MTSAIGADDARLAVKGILPCEYGRSPTNVQVHACCRAEPLRLPIDDAVTTSLAVGPVWCHATRA